jgi:DNA helicase HerA-like ATPase
MHDFEKLGAFYLGKRYDTEADKLTEEFVLYDSKDLTTHAAIIGMTGSGKTGLGIGILEEAALDHIPVIAIDPKGDMGNLLLTFPQLKAENFRPWINPRTALDKGQTPDEFAAAQPPSVLGSFARTSISPSTHRAAIQGCPYPCCIRSLHLTRA